MIKLDIEEFVSSNWENYKETIKIVSMDKKKNTPLVDSTKMIYNFDKINEDLYTEKKNNPTSVDGILLKENEIIFVEFKSGFKKRITRSNFDRSKMTCPKTKKYCNEYAELFFRLQGKDTKELINSIKFKAIESYITFEKKVFPKCTSENCKKFNINLIVVIDEEQVDYYESTLLNLTNNCTKNKDDNCKDDNCKDDNCYISIGDALRRFKSKKDINGKDYFYDEIKILSASDFVNYLDNNEFII